MKPQHIFATVLSIFIFFNARAETLTNAAPEAAKEKTKTCFQCLGKGMAKCQAPSCQNGQVDCPGPCLKLSKGKWIHMRVDGHPDTDIWQDFRGPDGTGTAWNQNHVGDVIQMQNGHPVNIGKCSVCGGTGHVKCEVCKGTGIVTCPICGGLKVVPESWTAFDNPKLKKRPDLIRLKDGRVLIGREIMASGGFSTIRTEKGDVEIATASIVSKEKQATQK